MIALAAVGQAQSTRQNRSQRLVYGFVAGVACRLGGLAMSNVVAVNAHAVPILYAIPVGATVVSLTLIATASQPRFGRWYHETVAPVVAAATQPVARLFARLFARPVRAAGG